MRMLAAGARAVSVAAMLCLTTSVAAGQSAQDREALDAVRDSLSRATAGELDGYAQDWSPERGSAMRHLRGGLIALRRGELTGERGPLDDALVGFGEAVVRERDWPYPRYGLALAKLALNDGGWVPKPSVYHQAGRSWYAGFVDALAESLEADPAFGAAESLLVTALAAQGQREQPERLVRLLRAAAASPEADPRVHLVLGRAYRASGADSLALESFQRFAAAGRKTGQAVAALELARALYASGDTAAAVSSYWAGLDAPTAEDREAYREDLAWIADSADLRAYDTVPSEGLEDWLRDFWSDRDAVELRPVGARLREHLRRWNHVYASYRIHQSERRTQFERRPTVKAGNICFDGRPEGINDLEFDDPTWRQDARRRERLLDDRAIIYMRHGEPARRTTVAGGVDYSSELSPPGVAAMTLPQETAAAAGELLSDAADPTRLEVASAHESWLYWFDGAPRLFHFAGGDAAGRHAPTTLVTRPVASEGYLLGLASADPRYGRLAFLGQRAGAGQKLARPLCHYDAYQDLRRERRTDMIVAVNTDSHTRLFPVDLRPIVQAYVVGDPTRGAGRVLVVFAVAGDRLTPRQRTDGQEGVAYPLMISAVAFDSTHGVVRRIDTGRIFAVPDTVRAGQHLAGYVELAVPPGVYAVRAAVVQDSLTGGSGYRRGVEVRGAAGLALSDIVLGRAGSGLVWPREGERVPLNPLGAYEEGETAELYYEVTGTVPGRSYTTTIEIHRGERGDRRTGTSLRFDETARGTELQVSRSLGLRGLRAGSYRLRVSLEEAGSDRSVSREQTILITGD